ncbi:alpha/beta hydrolase [Wenyingzhuangia marina]|uniref:Phospholipase/carboxylesterase n=1 Tax=Wenyingzhuangia marina TaxID=1195760 RepID=A0A1M5W5H2_9FLAO|nr:dienelactone hydrolase family protein [Wenyingzhuangia marina]GGF75667.1 phospholipase [Wenyingzhuangia marina]SHH82772.1 phospholipase/carboxylesterase [Wenyingzhuangia marina]
MTDLSLEYLVQEPSIKTDKTPLILLIHGYGSNKEDLFSFASELPKEALVISVQAPIALPFGGYAWYSITFDADENKFSDPDEGKASVQKLNIFLEEIIQKYKVDENNIFLTGFSQGAILSYAFSFTFPEKVQHVAAMSGYFNHDFLIEKPTKNKVDYFISHGTVDQIIPVDWARKAPDFLTSLGVDSTYKEYPVGHGIHPNNFYDYKDWILKRI